MVSADPWYRSSVPELGLAPLAGDTRTDVAIIGGGLCGLAAAVTAAGTQPVLLEAGRLADGGSGRNGGQVVPGWNPGPADLIQRFGVDRARELMVIAEAAIDWLRAVADPEDWRPGHLIAAVHPRHRVALEQDLAAWRRLGVARTALWSTAEVAAATGSERFHGGLFDRGGGQINPARLASTLAAQAIATGARLHPHTPVLRLEGTGPFRLITAAGTVTAERVLLAADGANTTLWRGFAGQVLTLVSAVAVTEPLAQVPMPRPLAVSDTSNLLDYFRCDGGDRLIYGGLARFDGSEPADIEAALRPHVARTYPNLATVTFSHAWSGRIAFTANRMPVLAQPLPGLAATHGFSGHGVAIAGYAGVLAMTALLGSQPLPACWATIRHRRLPQGWAGQTIGRVAGAWYGLKDRIALVTARSRQ